MTQTTQFGLALTGPATGSQVAARANETFNSLLSSNSGNTEPAYKVRGTLWEDTTAGVLKRWDGTKWRVISVDSEVKMAYAVTVSADVSLVVIDIPSDAAFVRVSGFLKSTINTVDAFARWSRDGTTYDSGANTYWRNIIAQAGSQAAPALSGATETGMTSAQLNSGLTSILPSIINALFHVGDATIPASVLSTASGAAAGVGATLCVINTRGTVNGRIQKISIGAAGANIQSGSRLFVEFF